ncbi:hypothetical protein SAMN02745900_03505 [Pseudomonas sp. URIL14HWK12:I8]|nr:hypothetical protein SAMN02745900_03505 [Pseudomonas sp. URIL14HWK12:I8]
MSTPLPPVTLRTFIKAWLVIIWGVAQRIISFNARMGRKSGLWLGASTNDAQDKSNQPADY